MLAEGSGSAGAGRVGGSGSGSGIGTSALGLVRCGISLGFCRVFAQVLPPVPADGTAGEEEFAAKVIVLTSSALSALAQMRCIISTSCCDSGRIVRDCANSV